VHIPQALGGQPQGVQGADNHMAHLHRGGVWGVGVVVGGWVGG
jgi:hypothetical protein